MCPRALLARAGAAAVIVILAATTTTTPVAAAEYGCYIGCYYDREDWRGRDMPHRIWSTSSVPGCASACSSYSYFAKQHGGQCYCGNSYGNLGKAPDSDCSRSGGGTWRNAVYYTRPRHVECEAGSAPKASCEAGGTRPCEKCPYGTFAAKGGAKACADAKCAAGTTDHDSNPATPCANCTRGTYTDWPGNIGACRNVTKCAAGTEVSRAPTPARDVACTACAAGTTDHDADPATPCASCSQNTTYADTPGNVGECKPVTQCAVGTEVSRVPTLTRDANCTACPEGTADHDADPATPCAECTPGFAGNPCTTSTTTTATTTTLVSVCRAVLQQQRSRALPTRLGL